MRRIIAVITCGQYQYQDAGGGHQNGLHEYRNSAVKKTWFRTWREKYQNEIDLKFFFGRCNRSPQENEIKLDCDDSYYGLPEKVQHVDKWALDNGYEHVCKVDDDVWLNLPRLFANLPENDYTGYAIESDTLRYASGTCYWLSKRAMKLVADAEIPAGEWREDRHVGQVLANAGIGLTHDARYLCCSCDDCLRKYDKDSLISLHLNDPNQMYSMETQ